MYVSLAEWGRPNTSIMCWCMYAHLYAANRTRIREPVMIAYCISKRSWKGTIKAIEYFHNEEIRWSACNVTAWPKKPSGKNVIFVSQIIHALGGADGFRSSLRFQDGLWLRCPWNLPCTCMCHLRRAAPCLCCDSHCVWLSQACPRDIWLLTIALLSLAELSDVWSISGVSVPGEARSLPPTPNLPIISEQPEPQPELSKVYPSPLGNQ